MRMIQRTVAGCPASQTLPAPCPHMMLQGQLLGPHHVLGAGGISGQGTLPFLPLLAVLGLGSEPRLLSRWAIVTRGLMVYIGMLSITLCPFHAGRSDLLFPQSSFQSIVLSVVLYDIVSSGSLSQNHCITGQERTGGQELASGTSCCAGAWTFSAPCSPRIIRTVSHISPLLSTYFSIWSLS